VTRHKAYSNLTRLHLQTQHIDGIGISLLLASNESRSLCLDNIHSITIWTLRRQPVNLQDSETGEAPTYHYIIRG